MRDPLVDQLLEAFIQAVPGMDADERRLSIEIYRALARGRPVPISELRQRTGLALDRIEGVLASWPGVFRDAAGDLIGYWGLAIREMPHRFETRGVRLHNWCAWDALFIPEIVGQVARYAGRCPVTECEIHLEIGPEGVRRAEPEGVAMSFLAPDAPFGSDVITTFCHHIHFFASTGAAALWAGGRPGHVVLSLEQAVELARRKNQRQYGDALGGSSASAPPAAHRIA